MLISQGAVSHHYLPVNGTRAGLLGDARHRRVARLLAAGARYVQTGDTEC